MLHLLICHLISDLFLRKDYYTYIWHTCLQCRPEASLANPCSLDFLIQEDKYLPKNYTEEVIFVCFMNLIMFFTYGHMLDARC
jgi:hypothetical protein